MLKIDHRNEYLILLERDFRPRHACKSPIVIIFHRMLAICNINPYPNLYHSVLLFQYFYICPEWRGFKPDLGIKESPEIRRFC